VTDEEKAEIEAEIELQVRTLLADDVKTYREFLQKQFEEKTQV
jgi:hypothetical protein